MRYSFVIFFLFIIQSGFSQLEGLSLEGEAWKGVQEFEVKGKNGILKKQKLTFGEYKTLKVHRSWTTGYQDTEGFTLWRKDGPNYQKVVTTDYTNKEQTFYFSLSDTAGHASKAFCVSQVNVRDFNIGNNPGSALNLLLDVAGKGGESSSIFLAKIYLAQSSDPWELYLNDQAAQTHPKEVAGVLRKNDQEYYTIIPVTRIKNKKGKSGNMPFGSAGFEIRNQTGTPLAAVSMMGNGVIYLTALDDQQRLLLSTVCAALLLQEEIL